MTLWTELARTSTEAGDEIILRQRDRIHEIRFNGIELMSNLNPSVRGPACAALHAPDEL